MTKIIHHKVIIAYKMRTVTITIHIIIKAAIQKLPRCLTPVCHDITLSSNITCSVSFTDSPYLMQYFVLH